MNKMNLIILILLSSIMYSQTNVLQNIIKATKSINTVEQKNLSKAKSHERAGLIKEADLIYSQLFEQNPSSQQIFESYKNFLKKQGDWNKLIIISKTYAENISDSPYGKLALADTYFIIGEDDTAYILFDELFTNYSSDMKILKRFISKLIYNNKIEYAEKKIYKIRIKHKDPDFYSMDLGKAYLSKMEYEKSLDEYILYLNNNINHMNLVRNRLMAFPSNDNIKKIIEKKLKANTSKISNIVLAEYQFKWKNYSEAYNLMMKNYLNEQSLYNFSIDMMMTEQFEYAEKILSHLLNSDNKNIVELSIYQLATILESKAEKKIFELPISDKFMENSFSQIDQFNRSKLNLNADSIIDAITMYDSLIVNFNNAEAKFKLAKLNFLINKDYEKAILSFMELEKKATQKTIRFLSGIEIIDLYILNNNINQELLDLINSYKKKYKKESEQALLDLKLNLIYFYTKDFEKVSENLKEKLKTLSKDSDYYNDFVDGLTMIMLFNNNEEELSMLSDSFLSIKQGDIDKALLILTDLNKSESNIVENLSSYYKSYIYIYKNDYKLALDQLSIIDGDDIFSQLSKLLLAEIKDYIQDDINGAIDVYLNFLENYESSIYYEDIRLRLRELIG